MNPDPMHKPQMMLKWQDEKTARPISRAEAAYSIRSNRKTAGVEVLRLCGETRISIRAYGIACRIYRREQQASDSRTALGNCQSALQTAMAHLQAVLNKPRTHAEQQAADTAARDWLASVGSEPI